MDQRDRASIDFVVQVRILGFGQPLLGGFLLSRDSLPEHLGGSAELLCSIEVAARPATTIIGI